MKLYGIVKEQEKKHVSIIQKRKDERHSMMIDRPSRTYIRWEN